MLRLLERRIRPELLHQLQELDPIRSSSCVCVVRDCGCASPGCGCVDPIDRDEAIGCASCVSCDCLARDCDCESCDGRCGREMRRWSQHTTADEMSSSATAVERRTVSAPRSLLADSARVYCVFEN